MKLLLLLALPEAVRARYLERLSAEFPELQVDMVSHHSEAGAHVGDAEILITFGAHMDDSVLEAGTRLRWVQALGTGTDGITDRPGLRDGVLVTNIHGRHGAAVSEAALALMLALARGLPRSLALQREQRWQRFPVSLLQGKTAVIVGVGAIAEELAPRCGALGMRVVGVSSRDSVPHFDELVGRDQLTEAAARADYLVLLIPYTAESHGIIGAEVLAVMKPSAYLINVARGGVVDEAALIAACRDGRIAGAGLDVFAEEPLPAGHPLWTLDNVIVTPHTAGFHVGYADEVMPIVIDNIRHFLAGETEAMRFVVRR